MPRKKPAFPRRETLGTFAASPRDGHPLSAAPPALPPHGVGGRRPARGRARLVHGGRGPAGPGAGGGRARRGDGYAPPPDRDELPGRAGPPGGGARPTPRPG